MQIMPDTQVTGNGHRLHQYADAAKGQQQGTEIKAQTNGVDLREHRAAVRKFQNAGSKDKKRLR